jgi:hypothetical protein
MPSAQQTDLDAGGPVSCFDYCSFGSVQAQLKTSVATAVSGTDLRISGTLHNANKYPVVGGSLYVKVFRLRDGNKFNANGPYVVDQFIAKDDIAIPAGGDLPVSFTWKVPSYALSGNYRIATFFETSHKYDLLGLTFTDDVVGNSVDFKVVGEQQSLVSFDKDAISVNGTAFTFASPMLPQVSGNDAANISVDVVNTTDHDQVVPISWQAYSWSALDQSNRLDSKNVQVTVKAHGKTKATYSVSDASNSVYLVVGTLNYQDSKSIVDVRFTRTGLDKLRLNFPALTVFPLTSGESATMFSCFHNTAMGTPNGKLDLALYDEHHNRIAHYEYNAPISGDMQAAAKRFTPDRDYDHVTLEATLYQDGTQIDHDVIHYDCDTIDPSTCRKSASSSEYLGGATGLLIEIVGGVAVIILLLYIVRYIRKRTHVEPSI